MLTKHFFKMLLGLIAMAILGIVSLILINHYHKATTEADAGAYSDGYPR